MARLRKPPRSTSITATFAGEAESSDKGFDPAAHIRSKTNAQLRDILNKNNVQASSRLRKSELIESVLRLQLANKEDKTESDENSDDRGLTDAMENVAISSADAESSPDLPTETLDHPQIMVPAAHDDVSYLEPDFDPNTLTVARLRNILCAHGVDYGIAKRKADLVKLFYQHVTPASAGMLDAMAHVKRSDKDITDA